MRKDRILFSVGAITYYVVLFMITRTFLFYGCANCDLISIALYESLVLLISFLFCVILLAVIFFVVESIRRYVAWIKEDR